MIHKRRDNLAGCRTRRGLSVPNAVHYSTLFQMNSRYPWIHHSVDEAAILAELYLMIAPVAKLHRRTNPGPRVSAGHDGGSLVNCGKREGDYGSGTGRLLDHR